MTLGGALFRLTLRRRPRRVGHATRSKPRSLRQPRTGGAGQPDLTTSSEKARRLLPHAIMVTASASVAFLSVGVIAWVVPATRVDSRAVAYTQRATLTYRASVPASPVYPTGRLVTGDPVYLALVPALDVVAAYRMTTSAAAALGGTRSVDAVLSTQDGWTRTVPLVPRGPFHGDAFGVTAHLDLAGFARMIRDVEAATQVPIGGYTLTVRVDVHLAGSVAGQPVDQRIAPALAFSVDDHVVRLTQAQSGTPGYRRARSGAARRSPRRPGRCRCPSGRRPPSPCAGTACPPRSCGGGHRPSAAC